MFKENVQMFKTSLFPAKPKPQRMFQSLEFCNNLKNIITFSLNEFVFISTIPTNVKNDESQAFPNTSE